MSAGSIKIWVGPHAFTVPFDKDNTPSLGFISETTQEAIEEVRNAVNAAASPGYPFGKSGNVNKNSWLYRVGRVPSNKAGYNIGASNAAITRITTATENLNTYDLTIYQHDGDEVNLTVITTVSITASRKEVFSVSLPLTTDKQLACRLTDGSAKNIGVDIQLSGTLV